MSVDSDVHFYTIASELYFPGCVGMLNSLRLAGHDGEATVLEREMSRAKQAVLRKHCRVVSLDCDVRNPCHLTAYPSQFDTQGVVVLLDSDLIVLNRLHEAISEARKGRICLFRDPDDTRFFPEWKEIFDLSAPLRRQPYFNTGVVAFSVEAWPHLLDRWWNALKRIWDRPSFMEGAPMRDDPTSQPDQDALNALMMSEFPADAVHELPAFRNVFPGDLTRAAVTDLDAMACHNRGAAVDLVQCSGSPKPWTFASLTSRRNAGSYLTLLRRTVAGPDVPIQAPRRLLPPWLWRGLGGTLAYSLVRAWVGADIVREQPCEC